jgi:hypothetical protein
MSASRYDAHTIELMRTVLDDAWNALTPTQQRMTQRSDIAALILQAASEGERDPVMLREAALGVRELALKVA